MSQTSNIEWAAIPGYPGYFVTETGFVRGPSGKVLKAVPNEGGYLRVQVYQSGKGCSLFIHKAVLLAFIGPCPVGREARHRDGHQLNNSKKNLEWGTKLENAADKRRHGTLPRGERAGTAKLTAEKVREIRGRVGSVRVTHRNPARGRRHHVARGSVRPRIPSHRTVSSVRGARDRACIPETRTGTQDGRAMMRGLSLTQPWATLVATGAKVIETRSWSTSYRGLIAIHAAKGFPLNCQALCWRDPFASALIAARFDRADQLPRGAVVAVARILHVASTDVLAGGLVYELAQREQAFGDFSPGRFGWVLGDVRRLQTPIPCKGALGLWTVPADVSAVIAAQLGRAA